MQFSDRYVILGEIATGSTATVYLAMDSVLRRKVALKILHPHLHGQSEAVRRFAKEAIAIAALSHENIVKVFEYGDKDSRLFLAMEYIDGPCLDEILKSKPGPLPVLATLCLIRQLLRGLAAAHERSIHHRDIKPSNVLIDRGGSVRLADFGIAFLAEEASITRTGSFLGTPGYSAPEQADGRCTTDKSDVFSTGILLYRCITGKLPFEGETPHAVLRAIIEKTPVPPQLLNPRLLPGLGDLLGAMLDKDPTQRPTALEGIARIEALTESRGFLLEPRRLSGFLVESSSCAEAESAEIASRFLDEARSASRVGEARKAVKLYALAETFAAEKGEIHREAEAYLKILRSRNTRRILIGTSAAVIIMFASSAIWWSGRFSENVPANAVQARPQVFAIPLMPVPLPSEVVPPIPQPEAEESPKRDSGPGMEGNVGDSQLRRMGGNPDSVGGRRKTRPKSPGASEEAQPVQIESAAVASLPAANQEKAEALETGFLLVKTRPPFARVLVDGEVAGYTPTKVPLELVEGLHEISLEREGCKTHQTTIGIVAGETNTLRLTLEKSGQDRP